MTFKLYIKDVFGIPRKYPADKWSEDALYRMSSGQRYLTPFYEESLKFFGVELEQVIRPDNR